MSFIQNIKNEILNIHQKSQIQQYVADVFLTAASGSIKKGYQIDFVFESIKPARVFADMLAAYDILPKLMTRSGKIVIYIKTKECVCNFLALVGANKSLLELNNEIVLRELRSSANRRANCDTHNIERSVLAAGSQLETISGLDRTGRLVLLDPKLREVAQARLNNPEANLEELAHILNLSKSGVVNRLRKLLEMSD